MNDLPLPDQPFDPGAVVDLPYSDRMDFLADWIESRDALVIEELNAQFPDYMLPLGTEVQDDLRVVAEILRETGY